MSLTKYDKYKDSGIEWLGEIPNHWTFSRIKNIGSVNGRVGWKALKASEYVDSGYFFLATPNIKGRNIDYTNVNYITYERFIESPEIILRENDILLTKDGSTLGTLNIVKNIPGSGTVNSSIAVLRFKRAINTDFVYFLIVSEYLQNVITQKKDGMGVPHLFQKDINNFLLLIPSLYEQTTIASYLKLKTFAIDHKVTLLEQKIIHYQQLRKSLINETVCRGLDKRVKLKDSGIEWIGMIPEHWEVKRLKDLAKIISGYAFDSNEYIDNGINIIRIGDIVDNIDYAQTRKVHQKYLVLAKECIINKGDILIAMTGATIGKSSIYDSNVTAILNQRVGSIRVLNSFNPTLLRQIISSAIFQDYISIICGGSAQENIGKSQLEKFPIQYPPISEQTTIATYLYAKTQKIDSIVFNIKSQIEALKELRKTLINDVVTGKIKVTD
ncbi:MAG: restriction endonuclease subunit S [Mariniphaga sp.]|nr:restriction endonuclease subunit S [Mariniphaga sp.]